MIVKILDKRNDEEIKKTFRHVWECRDDGNGEFVIKFHNNLCHRYPFESIEILSISMDKKENETN